MHFSNIPHLCLFEILPSHYLYQNQSKNIETALIFLPAVLTSTLLPFAAMWMHIGNIMLSEISLTEKDKYYMISLICGI